MNDTTLATRCNVLAMMMTVTVVIGGAPFLRAAARPEPGTERRWALDFRTQLEQKGGAQPIEVELHGDWISTVAAVRSGEYDAALRIGNLRIGSAAKPVPAGQAEPFLRRMQRPFWATYRDDGSLVTVHFYKEMDPTDRNLLLMIATECQFVTPAANRNSWTATERDGAGEYLATYDRTAPNLVTKKKVKYVNTDRTPGKSDGVPVQIEQSESRFTLDAAGAILALDAKIGVRINAGGGGAGELVAVTETHLAGMRLSQDPEIIGSLTRAGAAVETSPVRTQQPDPAQLRSRMDGQLLEGRATESLLAAALADTGNAKGSDPMLPERLAALFRQRPEACAAAVGLLRQNGPRARITDALGMSGSPAAIAALSAVAGDRNLSRPLRVDALTAFVLMQDPRVEAMRAPARWMDDPDAAVASAARIASGSLAHAGRAAHQEAADAIDAALAGRYRQTQNVAGLTDLLAAMGNSAGQSVVVVIEGALRDPRAAIRAAAVRALRLAPGAPVDRLVSTALARDPDAAVRGAAIFAAGFRNPIAPELAGALVQAARSDSAEQVRTGAITLLRQRPAVVPNLKETFQWIAQHDPIPAVRALAQTALKSL